MKLGVLGLLLLALPAVAGDLRPFDRGSRAAIEQAHAGKPFVLAFWSLDMATAMTPYEALANMFSRQRAKLDPSILKLLIKSMGVYPPGSIVRLSSGDHGMVISVNPSKPLRPCVMLHLPEVPRKTPMLIDLGEEASLSITQCLRPNQLPKEALDYLSPGKRISYYFDKEPPKAGQ